MLENIWTAIAIGHRVVKTLGALKKDVDSFRSGNDRDHVQFAQMEALDKRTGELELLAKEQDDRLGRIENSLNDVLTATEAVARRAGTIFWMALVGCALSVPALVLSLLSFVLHR
jgi:hypothetical protein